MGRPTSLLLLLLATLYRVQGVEVIYGHEDPSKNLVNNWNFESAVSSNDWVMKGCKGTKISGGHMGSGLRITNRATKQGGAYQLLTTASKGLKKNTNYYMSMHIRLESGGSPYIMVTSYARVIKNTGAQAILKNGFLKFQRPTNKWQQIGGDFKTPNEGFRSVELYLFVEPANVVYSLDTAGLIELKRDPNWKAVANQQIAQHRKNDLLITGSISNQHALGNTRIKLDLMNHEFGFGTAVKADHYNRQLAVNVKYKNFIHKNFNWAVFENAMKWKPMEKAKGAIKYARIDTALDSLLAHNFTMRGHTAVWAVDATNPNWVLNLKGGTMENEVRRRIKYVMERYGSRIYEWDVCNEYLQKHFFEDATGKLDMLELEFRLANQYAPNARLCLNDYLVIRAGGWLASNQANLAQSLLDKNIPCHCIGIQSHLRNIPIDPERIEHRLKVVGKPGLPISITEFSAHSANNYVRADGLETAFRVYFANPKVESITLWGFADQFNAFANDYYLTTGSNFTPTVAGNRFLALMNEWHTRGTYTPAARSFSKTVSAFRGKYSLSVEVGGVQKFYKEFQVKKGTNRVNFSI